MSLALATPAQRAPADHVETRTIAGFLVIAGVVIGRSGCCTRARRRRTRSGHDRCAAIAALAGNDHRGRPLHGIAGCKLAVSSCALTPSPDIGEHTVACGGDTSARGQARSRSRGVSHRRRPGQRQRPLGRIDYGCRVAELDRPVFGRLSLAGLPPLRGRALGESHDEIIRFGYLVHTAASRSRPHLLVERPGPGSDLAHHGEAGVG